MPHLVKMQQDFGGKDFSVVGLMQGSADKAGKFWTNHLLNYPILSENPDFESFDIRFLPTTYLVDPNGMIVADDLDDAAKILAKEINK